MMIDNNHKDGEQMKRIAEELGRVTGGNFRAGLLSILYEYERMRAGKEDKPKPLWDTRGGENDA
jgi:hypothetical protein